MTDYVLDTTALVALERDRTKAVNVLAEIDLLGVALRTPAPALTEFLGGARPGRRAGATWIASALRVTPVDERQARRAALLQQRAKDAVPRAHPSAIDALVAAEAERAEALLIIDGDAEDFAALASVSGAFRVARLSELTD
ncbi:MAG: PIN domain-containing protein [Chloroflexota bacterium]|nr:PIN domain-containing protein [Chloroflexota bacterium]